MPSYSNLLLLGLMFFIFRRFLFVFSIDSYSTSIKSNLEKHTDIVVEGLQKIISYKFDAAVDLLDFSTFIEPTRFEMSIRMFSMDKDANEVFGEDTTPNNFAGSVEVISVVPYYQLQDNQLNVFLISMNKMTKNW